ncbi:MAG TPA: hypothetical protein VFB41_02380 [Solirubrobacteraceae bacterium]|nr:hypothetical protein [Solirubrobacteraceae bacterium]
MPSSRQWPKLLLAALALATLVGFFVYPTYTTYDSLYSLLWGREVLHGHLPSFETYRAPTEHPLAILFGAGLSLFGEAGDRMMIAATLASFVALAAGMYRLAAARFTPLIGVIAAALLCTRFDFAFLAARGYIDIPYLAMVVWAAALEAEHKRRGVPVLVLLGLASLMRPEAWLLIGLYWLWLAIDPASTWTRRAWTAAVAAIGPVTWAAVDKIVTGDALYSLHSTSSLAEDLGRAKGVSSIPHASWAFLVSLDKWPVLVAGIAGILLMTYIAPKRLGMPLILLVVGLGTFVLVGLAGLSIINRYLLVPSLMVMIFAAVALGGWTMVEPGRVRTAWIAASAAVVVFGVVFTATHVTLTRFDTELGFRKHYHRALEQIVDDPQVRAAVRRCGPISLPNHKLIPDVRWLADLSSTQVVARSDPSQKQRVQNGVAIYVLERYALFRQAWVSEADDPLDQVPLPGFVRVATSRYYSAYVRCGGD